MQIFVFSLPWWVAIETWNKILEVFKMRLSLSYYLLTLGSRIYLHVFSESKFEPPYEKILDPTLSSQIQGKTVCVTASVWKYIANGSTRS